ncbi:MAG: amidohydrolase family protein [Hyphomicrobiaceae bacterium]
MTTANPAHKAPQPGTTVNFDVPAGACDCHTHIHGPTDEFPWFEGRVYTPETALPEEMASLHHALRMQRVVIVTPSVYGPDNRASVWGMKAYRGEARGVAVIDETTTDQQLDQLHRDGMRGIRLNLATAGMNDQSAALSHFSTAAQRMARRNWHVQFYTTLDMVTALKDSVLASPVPVVFDHFGGADAALGTSQPGFSDLCDLLESGRAYVKISGAYRASAKGPDYKDACPLAQALISANPDRILWGTDWPHPDSDAPGLKPTDVRPFYPIDDGLLLNQLPEWAPDTSIRRKILVDNPARLYGF